MCFLAISHRLCLLLILDPEIDRVDQNDRSAAICARLDRLGRYTGPPTGVVYTHQTVTVSGRRYKSIVMLCTVLCFRVILALLFYLTLVTVV